MSETTLSRAERRAIANRIAGINRDLRIIRDPWQRAMLARERRDLQDRLTLDPPPPNT